MSFQAMQEAIKSLTENEEYRDTLSLNPEKIVSDFKLGSEEWMAMNAESIISPRVAMTQETGMGCCLCWSPSLHRRS